MASIGSILLAPLRFVVRWFDSWAVSRHIAERQDSDKIDVLRVLPFVALHLACFAVIWVGVSPVAVFVAVGLYVLRMFALTGFYHRYFSG